MPGRFMIYSKSTTGLTARPDFEAVHSVECEANYQVTVSVGAWWLHFLNCSSVTGQSIRPHPPQG